MLGDKRKAAPDIVRLADEHGLMVLMIDLPDVLLCDVYSCEI